MSDMNTTKRNRVRKFTFRLSDIDYAVISEAAALIGQTISGWIRNEAVWAARAALDSKRRQRARKTK